MNKVLGGSTLHPLLLLKFISQLYSRNAMDNASKNASDMISTLTMQYNRGRQASITNELVDIITGMSHLKLDICTGSHSVLGASAL